jgi:hypothetical protein
MKYIVRPGAAFRLPDGSLASAGDVVELPSDVVAAHPGSVERYGWPLFDPPLPVIDTGPAAV